MANMHVLYGFSSEKIEKSINKELLLRGYDAKSVLRSTKELIKDYLSEHKEVVAVVLKEYLDGGGKYSAKELAELADVTRANIIVVLATNHRGKNEMKILYSAGILCAYFSDGKFGANPEAIAGLIVNGRGRKDARQYYKIDEPIPDLINLTYEEYRECLKYLVNKNEGLNIIDRFLTINRWLYPGQMGAFCDMIPDNIKEILMQYKEFYDVANKCYYLGYAKQKYKIPKGVAKGITKERIEEKEYARKAQRNEPSERQRVPLEPANDYDDPGPDYDEAEGQPYDDGPDENYREEPKKKKTKKRAVPAKKAKKTGLFGRKRDKYEEQAARRVEVDADDIYEDDGEIDFSRVQDLEDIPEQYDDINDYRDGYDEGDYADDGAVELVDLPLVEKAEKAQPIDSDMSEREVGQRKEKEDTEKGVEDFSNMSTDELMEMFGK